MTTLGPKVDPHDTIPFWMDQQDLCRYVSISGRTVDNWVLQQGFPPGRMRGGKLFWKRTEVDAWMDGGSDKLSELTIIEKVRNEARKAANGR